MKQRNKHRCRHVLPITPSIHQVPVLLRRVRGIYGADHKEFSLKNPDLDHAVEGYIAILQSNKIDMLKRI